MRIKPSSLYGRRRKTSDRLASGWFERRRVHRGASLLRRLARVSPATHIRTFPASGVGNNEKHIQVWLLRTSRLVGQLATFIEAAGNARAAARAVGVPIAASDITRRAGSIHRLSQHSFDARGGSDIALVSIVGPTISAIGAGRLSPPRRPGGCSPRWGHARAWCRLRTHSGGRITPGCTRRRRARFFHSARGERV